MPPETGIGDLWFFLLFGKSSIWYLKHNLLIKIVSVEIKIINVIDKKMNFFKSKFINKKFSNSIVK